MLFVLCPNECLLDKLIALILSILTAMGNFNPIPIVSYTCLTNMISFVTSDNAMYSASVDDRVTLLLAFDFQDIKATSDNAMYSASIDDRVMLAFDFQDIKAQQKYKFHPKTLMRVS
jgi:hypothetical protein